MALFVGSLVLAADDKPAVKEIPAKDLKVKSPEKGSKTTEPTIYTAAEDVAQSPVVGGAVEEVKKQVNFEKEKLVVFAWRPGKALDRHYHRDKKTTVEFTTSPTHSPLQSKDADEDRIAKWRVKTGRFLPSFTISSSHTLTVPSRFGGESGPAREADNGTQRPDS